MRILLATGIYPPQIGGPATYVQQLAGKFHERGLQVSVLTYGEKTEEQEGWPVTRVSLRGGPLLRWWRYSRELKKLGEHADIVYAFSAVSVGVPLMLAGLQNVQKILRLGGDFGWERATDAGASGTLSQWYETNPWQKGFLKMILRRFQHIVFSTSFQEALYERAYTHLPVHSVIENALPDNEPVLHQGHTPLRLLFMGRFVAFKNLLSLLDAMTLLPDVTLSLVGDGPMLPFIQKRIHNLSLADRVTVYPPVSGQDKRLAFLSHDILILPSWTEISPNVALEARSLGLPVLLTEETGLSISLRQGMAIEQLRTPEQIAKAVSGIMEDYNTVARRAAATLPERPWDTVADEHMSLFQGIL